MDEEFIYIYKCDNAGCGLKYAVTQKPLSCPYCDSGSLYDEPYYIYDEKQKP